MPRRIRITGSEHEEQKLLVAWCAQMALYCRELSLLYAIPNEMQLGWKTSNRGTRYNPIASRFKAEGMQGGVPDLNLPVSRQGFLTLYIEMKVGDKYLSEKQREWCWALMEQGHRVDLCYSFEQAREALCDYLGIEARFT